MRLEDTTPAEFLFGQLANNLLKQPNAPTNTNQVDNERLNAVHSFLTISNISLIFLALYWTLFTPHNMLYVVLVFLFARMLVQSASGVVLLNKFGPDMKLSSNRLYFFSLSQILISHTIFAFFSGITYFIVRNIPISSPFTYLESWMGISIFLYIFLFTDIQIVSLGFGTGIINQSSGLKSMMSNFITLSRIKGKVSTQLAILRLGTWFCLYYLLEHQYWYFLVPVILLLLVYTIRWERINASSIFMEIRGMILSAKPAILPSKILNGNGEEEVTPNSIIFPQLSANKLNRNKLLKRNSKVKKKSRIGNLQPLAVKSINRIAESIKQEENMGSSHLIDICQSCNMEVLKTTNYCSYCGARLS